MMVKAGSTFSVSDSIASEEREHMLAELDREHLAGSRHTDRDGKYH